MSATNSTAIQGRSTNVGPLAMAVALAAIVAVGAVGVAISQGVGSTSAAHPAAGPAVLTNGTLSGPKNAAQKGLAAHQAAIAATKDADASVSGGTGLATPYSGSDFAGQYEAWLKGQGSNGTTSRFVDGRISAQQRMPQ